MTGTLLDPGATTPAGQSTAWAKLWRAVPYGYSPHYLATIEGDPYLHVEYVGDAIAPTDYTLDASLVIDRSSPVGSIVSSGTHVAAAFDLDMLLLDTPAVRDLMQQPSLVTRLSQDVDAADTAFYVDSIAGWTDTTVAYIGTSAEVVTDYLPHRLIVATRGVYGSAKSYKAGTVVSDRPIRWEGRRVDLLVALRDPTGRYVQGASVLSNAVAVGGFYVQSRPVRDRHAWAFQCRDQVRRLTQPLGVAASGRAVWEIDDDGLVTVDTTAAVSWALYFDDDNPIENVVLRPFVGLASTARRSQVRAALASALEAAATASGRVSGFAWRRGAGPNLPEPLADVWHLYASVDVTTSDQRVYAQASVQGGAAFRAVVTGGTSSRATNLAAATEQVFCGFFAPSTPASASLSVDLDEGDPDSIPSTGFVQLEASGRTTYKGYVSAVPDAAAGRVNLFLDPESALSVDELAALVRDPTAEVSAKFYWRDTGRIYDVMRRAIVSTGDAVNGPFDTLPKGQGLALPDLNAASFVSTFDGFFRDMTVAVGSEAGTTFEDLFSGILRLSQRALASRRNEAGTAVEIAATRIGGVDSLPVATIDEDALLSAGPPPVRVISVFNVPSAINVKCRTMPVGDAPAGDAAISLTAKHEADVSRHGWDLDVYGVSRSALLPAAQAWAVGLFRTATTRQVIELSLPPWYDIQPGDCVALDLQDPNLWDYAPGTGGSPGFTGYARALGSTLSLQSGVQTVQIMIDGAAPGPLCPSLAITAVNGTATSPTSLDVDDEYYDLLTAAKDGEASFRVLAYLPGQDSGRAEYTVSGLSLPGGGVCRLTVSAYPSAPAVTLSTSHRITWPITSRSTDDQERYAHADQLFQWS